MKFRQIVIAAQALCCLIISTQAGAASVTTANEDVLKRMAVDYQVQTLDGAAIGEQIGLQRGSLSFKATDLNIKGNGPDIVIARTYKGENHSYHKSVDMADWSFDIPHIYTTVVRTMGRNTSGPWGKNKACSETMEPETMYYIVSGKDQFIEPNGFHNGDFLFSHESGTENLYEDNSQKFGANVTRITKSNWKFECIQFRHNGQTMEGFVGYSPSGLKYTFNQPIRERIKSGSTFGAPVTDIGIPAPEDSNSALYFHAKYLYVSKIEDRFGRAIEYQYDGDRLQSIVATDGRQVNFEYDPSSMHLPLPNISAITYAGRRFVYTYEQPAGALYRSLTRVDIGENLYWQYQLHEMSEYYPEGSSGSGERTSCAKTPRFSGSGGTVGNLSIKHPAGFKVRYEVQCTHFGRAKVPPKVDTLEGKKYLTPYSYGEIAIQKKTLDYDNGKSYVWQYQYSGNQGFSTDQAVTASNQLQGIALPSGLSPELLNATTVTHPNGSKTTSVYDRSFTSATEGALLFEFTKDAAGATLSSTQKRYEHTRVIGWNGVFFENGQLATYDTALTQNITKVFHNNQSSQYRTVLSDFDMFGRSGKKAEYSADESRVKYTKNTYLNDLTYWLLGQPVTSAISANDSSYQQTEEYKYYPANSAEKSSLKEYWEYQRKIYSLEYQADGNVSRKTYNLANRWVSYQDYQLGLPKLVQFPDRYDGTKTSSIALDYDLFSNVTKTTDFNGNVTTFSYDDVGRLELIDPASATIADTAITYTVLDSFRSQQVVRKGNYRAQGIYDGLRRAILTSEWDASDEASTRKQQVKEYDANNAVAFQSQFLSDANAQSPGTRFEFDGLGRLKKTVFANGHSEKNDYLSGHEIKHTNAKLQPTTTTYLALGAPDYSNPLRIEQPENITTTLAYNTAGYVTEITQGGYSETRVYDDKMQLCLQKRPETGIKAMQYNALGQLWKYADGLSGGGSHCLDYTNVADSWVSTVYDNHGEQSQLNFADGSSPNKVFRFDAQGNLKTLSAGGTVWDYTYNAAHQVETETLSIEGKSYVIDPTYNTLGHLTHLKYGGATVSYVPNALGQPTSVKTADISYAG
ncbi:MAG: RHS repeat protein, partial [Gammaproteobacteria bacterium]|nr:RHS repeat protein [Gammaproteobacteria bacterium]